MKKWSEVDQQYLDRYFWPKVRKGEGCWEWTAATNNRGYGQLTLKQRRWSAHRLSYTIHHGVIPDGYLIRHRCDNRLCVRPDHLEAGTHADNSRDMVERGRSGRNPRAYNTQCPKGHPFDEANTYWWKGARQCKACKTDYSRQCSVRSGAAARSNRLVGEARAALRTEAVERYAVGETLQQIADSNGRGRELIRALLVEAGVPIGEKFLKVNPAGGAP